MQYNFFIRPKLFFLLLATVAIFVFILILSMLNNHGLSNDKQKMADLMNIRGSIIQTSFIKKQNVLEYLSVGCFDTEILRDVVNTDFFYFINAHGDYTIGINESKTEFVLRVEVKKESTLILDSGRDVDGVVFGCDCDDPYYCFKTDLKEFDF